MGDVTEHADDTAAFGTPRKLRKSRRVRMEVKLRRPVGSESRYCGGIDRHAESKGPLKLVGHYSHIALPAGYIAEGQPYEFYVLLADILYNLGHRIFH